MRVLIYTHGTRGDIQPFAALAHALNPARHQLQRATRQDTRDQGHARKIGNERLGRVGMSVDLSNIPTDDQNFVLARMWHLHAERAD